MNPGAFDYEQWLFQNHIQATGYVRKAKLLRPEQAIYNLFVRPEVETGRYSGQGTG